MNKIELRVFGQPVRISADDGSVRAAILVCYSAFQVPKTSLAEQLVEISIDTRRAGLEWSVVSGQETANCAGLAFLLYTVEKLMTIELQRRRPDLFFMHAAALRFGPRCIVISGESGAGKSTLCWELCNAGFDYMSDELAPVNPTTMQVEPYPHAICLKSTTGGMAPLPEATLDVGHSRHVPVEAIPRVNVAAAAKIDRFVFLSGLSDGALAQPVRISIAEAAARIYANGLNQLAHDEDGLEAATRIATAAPSYLLSRGAIGDMRDALVASARDDSGTRDSTGLNRS